MDQKMSKTKELDPKKYRNITYVDHILSTYSVIFDQLKLWKQQQKKEKWWEREEEKEAFLLGIPFYSRTFLSYSLHSVERKNRD